MNLKGFIESLLEYRYSTELNFPLPAYTWGLRIFLNDEQSKYAALLKLAMDLEIINKETIIDLPNMLKDKCVYEFVQIGTIEEIEKTYIKEKNERSMIDSDKGLYLFALIPSIN